MMKLLRTPPAVVTLLGLLAFATALIDSGAGNGARPGIGYGVAATGYLLFTVGWCAALIRACSAHTRVAPGPWAARLPVIVALGLVLSAVLACLGLMRLPLGTVIGGVSALAYFALMLVTARSLSLGVGGNMNRSRIVGYFLLIVYLPLGIWALRRRVAGVLAN